MKEKIKTLESQNKVTLEKLENIQKAETQNQDYKNEEFNKLQQELEQLDGKLKERTISKLARFLEVKGLSTQDKLYKYLDLDKPSLITQDILIQLLSEKLPDVYTLDLILNLLPQTDETDWIKYASE